MTIDEAIKHCEEVAEELRNVDMGELDALYCGDTECIEARKNDCIECANDHRQLAEWLKELKQLREQTRWIPCSERLPERDESVLAYHRDVSFDYQYVSWIDDYSGKWAGFCGSLSDEVLAWMPLPEGYKAENEGDDEI